jgi:hypothetical protein
VPDSDPTERRVIEWLTTEAKGRQWQIEAAHKRAPASVEARGFSAREQNKAVDTRSVYLLNYYAVRYGYDLVLAS